MIGLIFILAIAPTSNYSRILEDTHNAFVSNDIQRYYDRAWSDAQAEPHSLNRFRAMYVTYQWRRLIKLGYTIQQKKALEPAVRIEKIARNIASKENDSVVQGTFASMMLEDSESYAHKKSIMKNNRLIITYDSFLTNKFNTSIEKSLKANPDFFLARYAKSYFVLICNDTYSKADLKEAAKVAELSVDTPYEITSLLFLAIYEYRMNGKATTGTKEMAERAFKKYKGTTYESAFRSTYSGIMSM